MKIWYILPLIFLLKSDKVIVIMKIVWNQTNSLENLSSAQNYLSDVIVEKDFFTFPYSKLESFSFFLVSSDEGLNV